MRNDEQKVKGMVLTCFLVVSYIVFKNDSRINCALNN